jgi:endonuclease YncB( thermonuclease family)
MAAPFLRAFHGELTVIGKRPDGDSIRFIPDSPEHLDDLQRADRKRISKTDGSLQLRLEGIDTPETHYGPHAQPMGERARDWLLEQAGFSDVVFNEAGTVTQASPERRAAVVLTKAFDPNGRPISYVLLDEDDAPADGEWTDVDAELLRRTLNARSLSEGVAYLTLYTSTPATHGRTLRALAREAREEDRGVWAVDETGEFRLADQGSIGPPDGALILPKLFRRCTDYLKAVEGGFAGTLPDWLVAASATGRRPENDLLLVCGETEVAMSAVVQQVNQRIRFTAGLLDIVFVEK